MRRTPNVPEGLSCLSSRFEDSVGQAVAGGVLKGGWDRRRDQPARVEMVKM
jgi:hypothetical protein